MIKYIFSVKQSFQQRRRDLDDKCYIKVQESLIYKEVWPGFARICLLYWVYSLVDMMIEQISSLVNQNQLDIAPIPFIYNQILFVIPSIVNFGMHKLSKRGRVYTISSILCLYQMIILTYIAFYIWSNNHSQLVINFSYIFASSQMVIMSAFQRSTLLRLIPQLFQIVVVFLKTRTDSVQSADIIFAILLIYFYFLWQWDSLLIRISKIKQIQKDSLQNIPNALIILNSKATKVLYSNKQLRKYLHHSSLQISLTKDNNNNNFNKKEEETYKDKTNIFQFFKSLIIEAEEIHQHFPELPENDYISLFDVIDLIKLQHVTCSYSFRCLLEDEDRHKILEVRIRNNIQYAENKAMFITVSDISKHFKSVYYKNMNKFKSKLIKSISHELRTRLNIIQGMIEIVLQSQNLDIYQLKLLKATYNNCRIQTYIIGSIIDYNLFRENQIQPQIQKCQLKSIFKDAITLFELEAELKNIKITFETTIDQVLDIDASKLLSCLVNIISNSIKFTQKDGTISIVLSKETKTVSSTNGAIGKKTQTIYQSMHKMSHSSHKAINNNIKMDDSDHQKMSRGVFPVKISSKLSNFSVKRMNSNPLTDCYKVIIKDTGIGIQNEKFQKILAIIRQEEDDLLESKDSSEGFMLGVRVTTQLLNYLNNAIGQWIFYETSSTGTQVTFYLKHFQGLVDVCHHQSESIEQEGSVKKINEMCFQNSPVFNELDSMMLSNYSSDMRVMMCNCEKEILIVDDEPYNLLVLEALFKCYHQQIIKADEGLKCVQIIRERIQKSLLEEHGCSIVKAIFMDYQMPLLNGRDAAKQILELCLDNDICPIPIYGCTGFSAKEDIEQLLQSGMREVFIKPITKKVIEEVLVKLEIEEFNRKKKSNYSPQYGYIPIEGDEMQQVSDE